MIFGFHSLVLFYLYNKLTLDLPREESHEAERKRRKLTWSMWGGWRQDGKKAECVKQGDLSRSREPDRSQSARSSEEVP